MSPSTRYATPEAVRLGPVEVFVGAAGGKYPDGNYVVVQGADSRVSFDMPVASVDLPRECLGTDLVILGHVHEDHTAGLARVGSAPVHVHAADVEALRSVDGLARHYGYSPDVNARMCERAVERFGFAPRKDAIAYEDGATWDLGGVKVRAIHAPGHTSGHCVLWVEPGDIAFIGDIDLSTFGPYYGDATSSLTQFRQSIQLVRQLPAACWITSHHKGIVRDRDEFLRLLARFESALDRRDEAIVKALRERPRSVAELAAMRFVYPRTFNDDFVDDVERRTIGQHLDVMLARGAVGVQDGSYFAR
jgi:glyoxylase-like metal-dependent hydrolase (beta-lactamase superfamily II)